MFRSEFFRLFLFSLAFTALTGCGGGDSDGEPTGGTATGSVSTDYPYLMGPLRVSYVPSLWTDGSYEVTVEADVAGPTPIYSVSLWIFSKTDDTIFDNLDLQNISGSTTWSATTLSLLPLPAGEYYIDSIMIRDGDPFADGAYRSGWYMLNPLLSQSRYTVDQRLTDPTSILEHNLAVSDIPVATFTLP